MSVRAPSETSRLEFINQHVPYVTRSKSGLKSSKPEPTWQGKVYHRRTEAAETLEAFAQVTKVIFQRDRFQCQACFRKREWLTRHERHLTCHHIIPRPEGGLNHENLITLCNQCHDVVEEKGYREKSQIYGSQLGEYRHYDVNISPDLDWHKWVYGGYRKPSN